MFGIYQTEVNIIDDVNSLSSSTKILSNMTISPIFDLIKYALTVFNGSGSGLYVPGTPVYIVADYPPDSESMFSAWTGDISNVEDISDSSTIVNMNGNTIITATYESLKVTVTVLKGSGSGKYPKNTTVHVIADPDTDTKKFNHWSDPAGKLINPATNRDNYIYVQ
jgi:hypothetical protein